MRLVVFPELPLQSLRMQRLLPMLLQKLLPLLPLKKLTDFLNQAVL
jgi:hypothetical protein